MDAFVPVVTDAGTIWNGGKLVRDGSLEDVVAVWMDRIVEEHWGRNPGDNEAAVYFAMLKHSVTGLLATHDRTQNAACPFIVSAAR